MGELPGVNMGQLGNKITTIQQVIQIDLEENIF
jgi:hypothetical protein